MLDAQQGEFHVAMWPGMSEPRYWEDYEVGQKYPLGSTSFTEQEIVDVARQFDPQPFHLDAEAAKVSMFESLIASGWHIAAKVMRLVVDNDLDRRTILGSPGLDELRWLKPVRPGDTLTGWIECAAKVPSKSKPELAFIHEHWVVTNQNGGLVMTIKAAGMMRRRPT